MFERVCVVLSASAIVHVCRCASLCVRVLVGVCVRLCVVVGMFVYGCLRV